jgi:hypothetical protein
MNDAIHKLGMPKWGLSMTEGRVIDWLVEEGAELSVGAEVAEVETEKIRVSARLGGEPAAAVSGWAGISRLENFSVVAQNAGDPQPPWRQGAGCSKVSDSPRRATCGSAPHSSACCDCQAPASSMSRSASGAWS